MLSLLAIFIIPTMFFQNALAIIVITFLCILSRSTPLYDSMRIEFHSVLILIASNLFGVFSGLFIVLASSPLVYKIGPKLGAVPHPLFHTLDIFYFSFLAIIGSVVSGGSLAFFGLITIIIGDHIFLNIVRMISLPEPFVKRIVVSATSIAVNYFLLFSFLDRIIAFISRI